MIYTHVYRTWTLDVFNSFFFNGKMNKIVSPLFLNDDKHDICVNTFYKVLFEQSLTPGIKMFNFVF